jgi:putative MATE family efflux protein
LQEHTEHLGTAPLGKLLLKLSVPSIASMITVSLYNIVDTFWVARLGHEAIAALTIVLPYQILIYAVGMGTGIGIGALVSRRFGENNIEATNHVAGQIFFISLIWGLLFMMTPILLSEYILPAFGATPDILEFATQYLVITAYGAPQIIFIMVTGSLIRGSGDAVKPMVMMITASVVNIILDPLMILGIGPFLEMGIRGAALATVIANSVGAAIGLYYLVARKTPFRISASPLWLDISILCDIYRVGAPAAVLEITESLSFVLFNKVVSAYGSIAIAAIGLVIRISDLAFMPIIGVSNGLLPIIGFNFGAKNFKRLWQAVKIASVRIMLLLAVFTILLEIFTSGVIGVFSKDPDLLEITVPAMRVLLSTTMFIGPTIMFSTVFQGLSRGMMALVLSLARQFLLFVPLLYLMSYLFGLYGVWLALPVSDVLSFALTFTFTYSEYNKHKKAYN